MWFDGKDYSAVALLRRVHQGALPPSRLVQASLDTIARRNGALNAFCTVAEDAALRAAREADARWSRGGVLPPLLGLPVGIKDVTDTAGIRTTLGSPLCRDRVPDRDADIVRRLKAAGAIVVGKTNTPEFAVGANTVNTLFGATVNPWDTRLSAGGSTGGGAAAVASGMIGLAQGTDLGGSLRVPAAFCGVVGLRPTPGLIPSAPEPAPWDTLQVDGPMAASAEDVWLALKALAGPCADSAVSIPRCPDSLKGELDPDTPRRVAYVADIAGVGVDPAVAAPCRAAVDRLAGQGWTVETVDLDLSAYKETFLTLRGAVLVSQLLPYLDRRQEMGDNLRGNLEFGLTVTTRQLAEARHQQRLLRQRLLALLNDFELIVTPCTPIPPFPVQRNYPREIGGRPMASYIDWVAPTFLLSLAGMPVASAPAGRTPAGLPVGLQILAAPWREDRVLAAAARLGLQSSNITTE